MTILEFPRDWTRATVEARVVGERIDVVLAHLAACFAPFGLALAEPDLVDLVFGFIFLCTELTVAKMTEYFVKELHFAASMGWLQPRLFPLTIEQRGREFIDSLLPQGADPDALLGADLLALVEQQAFAERPPLHPMPGETPGWT